MKFMGWSCADLEDCWADLIPAIHDEMTAEADARRQQNRRR